MAGGGGGSQMLGYADYLSNLAYSGNTGTDVPGVIVPFTPVVGKATRITINGWAQVTASSGQPGGILQAVDTVTGDILVEAQFRIPSSTSPNQFTFAKSRTFYDLPAVPRCVKLVIKGSSASVTGQLWGLNISSQDQVGPPFLLVESVA